MTDYTDLKRRLEAATVGVTPGPWLYRPDRHDDWGTVKAGNCVLCRIRDPERLDEDTLNDFRGRKVDPWEANARFTADARDLVPEALSAIAALEAENAKLRSELQSATAPHTDRITMGRAALNGRLRILEAERDALRADAAADVERKLRGLLRGQFSSLSIGFNDDHACNYVTAGEWPEYRDNEECRIEWASDEERERAISQNSVWTLQWYPNTPVGFNCIGASSLGAIIAALTAPMHQAPDAPAPQ